MWSRLLWILALTSAAVGAVFTLPAMVTRVAIQPVTGLAVANPVEDPAPFPSVGSSAAIDRHVFVLGDSLTVGISPYLPALLAADRRSVTIDGQVGRLTTTGISILAERAPEIGGTLVVALGTNDTPDPTVLSGQIDQVMAIAGARRVIWVTVARLGWDGFDLALLAARSRWENLAVIDWRPVIARHPDMRAYDGIHLTDAGYQLRARFIAGAIESTA